jgi:hypothetical protein
MFRAFSTFVPFVSSVSVALAICVPAVAMAQATDTIGVRAQGMGGAFTAVADDATASWWNPAGLAGGAYFNALIEAGSHRVPSTDRTATGERQSAWRADTRSYSVAFPALGLSYYRLQVSEIQPLPSTATPPGGRQEGGATEVRLRSLVLSQFGATVGQSIGEHLVVGSTLKLVSAGEAFLIQADDTASLDTAAAIAVSGETHGGLDVGAMAVFGKARIGLMIRNVSEIEFGSGPNAFTLRRHARLGGALSSGTRGVIGSATLAVDADLTNTATALGDERRVSVGAETWMGQRMFGVRGGINTNTIGSRRTSFSAGASAALKKGMYVDGEVTGGTDAGRRGWSSGLRVTF